MMMMMVNTINTATTCKHCLPNLALSYWVLWVSQIDFSQGTGDQIWFTVHRSKSVPATHYSHLIQKCFQSYPVQFISLMPHSHCIRRNQKQSIVATRSDNALDVELTGVITTFSFTNDVCMFGCWHQLGDDKQQLVISTNPGIPGSAWNDVTLHQVLFTSNMTWTWH